MRRLLCLLSLCCLCGIAGAATDFKIITLQHRFGQDLLSVVQPLAGPGGTVSAVDNKLIVQADAEHMAAIEQAVAMLDVERKTLRIHIDRSGTAHASGGGVQASGEIGSGNVRIQRSRPGRPAGNGVTVEADRYERETRSRGSEQLAVADGASATIAVGQSVPFTETWRTLARRYPQIGQSVQYHDVTTGFTVKPRMIGQMVELEIAPRIASLRQDGSIEFSELATTVRVAPGQWFDLGGTMQQRDEVSQAILAREGSRSDGGTQLWLMVEP